MFLKKIFGTSSTRYIKKIFPIVQNINDFYGGLEPKSDQDLVDRTLELKALVNQAREDAKAKYGNDLEGNELKKKILEAEQKALDDVMVEAFAMVKETCRRMVGQTFRVSGQNEEWNMIPYDVQLLGAMVLHNGKVSEMKTGEGKTLVATMPIYLNALTGRGVHVITVNDYLAQRDAEWMGEVYRRLGLTVGFILNSMDNVKRREMYACDITYGTNNEFGFDYLRNNMALHPDELCQRDYAFAVVDEVDSVLIDEARTPLIISGAVDAPVDDTFVKLKPDVQDLVRKQNVLVSELIKDVKELLESDKDKAGLKLLQAKRALPKHPRVMKIFQEPGTLKLSQSVESDYIRDKKLHEVDDDLYFSVDEKSHVMDITEKGRNVLAPNSPETFIIPDIGELLLEIDEKQDLDSSAKEIEKEEQRIEDALGNYQRLVDEQNEIITSSTKKLDLIDRYLEEENIKALQTLVGTTPDGQYGRNTAKKVTEFREKEEQKAEEVVASARQRINELRDNQGEERRLSNDLIDRLRKQISLDDLDEDDKARISNIKKNILTSEEELTVLNNIKFEFEKEVRKFEAEVGPVKYVAEVLYSDVDENVLEDAVRFVILCLIFVFDPLAILLVIASSSSIWYYRGINKGENLTHLTEEDFKKDQAIPPYGMDMMEDKVKKKPNLNDTIENWTNEKVENHDRLE